MRYSADLPAGTSRNSGPLQKSFWMMGLSCQSAVVVELVMVIFSVTLSRTAVAKVTAFGSASCDTQLPVSVRNCSSPPSMLHRSRSTRMSGSRLTGWKVMSSLTSCPGEMKPSVGKTLKLGAKAAASQRNLVPTSPVFSSCSRFTTRLPCTTAPNGRLSLASFTSVPEHAPWICASGRSTPQISTKSSSVKGRVRCSGRKLSESAAVSRARRRSSELGSAVMP
mmetsp:Transcript_3055/g.11083  ORF Transcript_3055/g.11083 Transcript_3055/m.11083 type:complete len:223 (+) Transcript_3055:1367-2035(+)